MIEAGCAQQPRRVEHEAPGQILELLASQARNAETDPLSAFALCPGFVCGAAHSHYYAEADTRFCRRRKNLRRCAHDPQGVDEQFGAGVGCCGTLREKSAPRAHTRQAGIQLLYMTDHRTQPMAFSQPFVHIRYVTLD